MHCHLKKALFFNLIYVKQAHIYRSLSKLSLLDRYEQTKFHVLSFLWLK